MERKLVLPSAALGLVAAVSLAFGCDQDMQESDALDTANFKTPVAGRAIEDSDNPTETPGMVASDFYQEAERIDLGDKVPNFEVYDVSGNLIRMADFEGRPVMILFDHSFQSPYLAKMAGLGAKYQSEGLVVLAVFQDRSDAQRANQIISGTIADELSFDRPSLTDLFGLIATPTLIIVDKDATWIDQRLGGERFVALDAVAQKLILGEEVPGFRLQLDGQALKVPLVPQPVTLGDLNQAAMGLAGLPSINPQDASFIQERVAKANELAPSEEVQIDSIINNLSRAGQRLALAYCDKQPEDVLKVLSQVTTYVVRKFEIYARSGVLDAALWPDVAANFNPGCPVPEPSPWYNY